MENFGLYLVITNPTVGYAECARAAVKAGVKIIQLRMKHVSREEIIEEARKLREITRGTDTAFIVNDDPEIAALVEADGVHVGQGDMSPSEVRRMYPSLKIVGLSTHNLEQVKASLSEPIDYIGVGPVYATPTKDIPDPTLGPDTAAEMIRSSKVPAVAIGGLDLETVKPVLEKGAKNFAVVRAVCKSTDPYGEIVKLKSLLK
ncbi:MAG: thiamine phosphate synthase [Kiritimatiellae bacterium]|nr:thiamine phosphate synthase [Kiritimatiellia bacterium]